MSLETNVPPKPEGFSLVVDLSRFQAGIDYAAIKAAGAVGAIVKATEGTAYVDPLFEKHAELAAQAGLQVGTYHVFHPEEDPAEQAKHYRAVGFDRCALAPVIDFELASKMIAIAEVAERALEFVEATVASWNKKRGLVYASPSFIASLTVSPLGSNKMAAIASLWDLWVAHYGVSKPSIPKPWTDYRGWQFSGGTNRIGAVPVDLSWFKGGELELAELGATT